MAETTLDPQCTDLRQKEKDEKLCNEIVGVLGRDGPQRVLLAGEAGIGKTRLATNKNFCFLTLCLHLNKKFEEDEWSLYENIASHLSVYSDFEETEVDDRDEDEEEVKKPEALTLADLKKNIIDEIVKQKNLVDKKKEEEEAEKANKEVKFLKETGNKNEKTTQVEKRPPAAGDASSTEKPYLLFIIDDEGNKTSENVVMKDLKLEKFLKDAILKEDTRLKILVTRRKGGEEPKKPAGEIESQDKKSEQGNEEQAESDNDIVSDEGTEPQDRNTKGEPDIQPTDDPHITDGALLKMHRRWQQSVMMKSTSLPRISQRTYLAQSMRIACRIYFCLLSRKIGRLNCQKTRTY